MSAIKLSALGQYNNFEVGDQLGGGLKMLYMAVNNCINEGSWKMVGRLWKFEHDKNQHSGKN